jgi:2-(1,2-epoxy-1,2-dihydrophenyl)acetyl-CoA isomerase
MEVARTLAHGPSIALSLMKRNLRYAESRGLAELLERQAAHQVQTGRTEDHREAAKAFLEKRPPTFTGNETGTASSTAGRLGYSGACR